MLSLTAVRGSVTFTYTDDNMTASWVAKVEDGEDKLIDTMKRIIAFVEGEQAKPALPERTPGMALEMAQMTHPAPVVTNGWAVQPEIPDRLQGEVEMIPPEEQE